VHLKVLVGTAADTHAGAPLKRLGLWLMLLAILVAAGVTYATVRHKRDLVDFNVFRTAGVRARSAAPLYRPDDGHYQFKYLPAFALGMVPIGAIDPEAGTLIWFAASVALLGIFINASVAALPDRRLRRGVLTWFALILMGKFYIHELALGQSNILLGAVLVMALLAAKRGQRFAAAALVSAAVFIKPYAVVLVPWIILVEGPATIGVVAAVLSFGLLAPAAVYGWQGNLDLLWDWYRTVTDTTAPNLLVPENISLGTMWAKWIGPGPAAMRLAVVTSVALVGLAGSVVAMRRRAPEPRYLEFGLLLLLVPLLSPQGWDYVLLLGTPAVLCIVDRWKDLSAPWRVWAAVSIGLMSFTIFDLLGRALYTRLMALSIVSVAACALAAVVAHLRFRALA
jgi:hypothetical protein